MRETNFPTLDVRLSFLLARATSESALGMAGGEGAILVAASRRCWLPPSEAAAAAARSDSRTAPSSSGGEEGERILARAAGGALGGGSRPGYPASGRSWWRLLPLTPPKAMSTGESGVTTAVMELETNGCLAAAPSGLPPPPAPAGFAPTGGAAEIFEPFGPAVAIGGSTVRGVPSADPSSTSPKALTPLPPPSEGRFQETFRGHRGLLPAWRAGVGGGDRLEALPKTEPMLELLPVVAAGLLGRW